MKSTRLKLKKEGTPFVLSAFVCQHLYPIRYPLSSIPVFISLSLSPFLYLCPSLSVCLFLFVFLCLTKHLSVCRFVCLSVCLSLSLSFFLFLSPSLSLFFYLINKTKLCLVKYSTSTSWFLPLIYWIVLGFEWKSRFSNRENLDFFSMRIRSMTFGMI